MARGRPEPFGAPAHQLLVQRDQLGPGLLRHRLAGRNHPLAGADPVAHRIHAGPELLPPGGGQGRIGHDRGVIEGADDPPKRPLARGILQHDAGRLRLLHQIGEGQDRIARDHPLGVVAAERDLPAGFAPHDAGVGHAPRQRFAQEVRHQLLHGVPPLGIGQVARLVRAQVRLRGRDRAHQLGPLVAGALQIAEEGPRRRERRVVGGGAEAVDGLRGEGAGLAFPRHFLGGLPNLVRKRRHDDPAGPLAHLRHLRHHAGGRREERVGDERGHEQRHPPDDMELDPVGPRRSRGVQGRARQAVSRFDPPRRP